MRPGECTRRARAAVAPAPRPGGARLRRQRPNPPAWHAFPLAVPDRLPPDRPDAPATPLAYGRRGAPGRHRRRRCLSNFVAHLRGIPRGKFPPVPASIADRRRWPPAPAANRHGRRRRRCRWWRGCEPPRASPQFASCGGVRGGCWSRISGRLRARFVPSLRESRATVLSSGWAW